MSESQTVTIRTSQFQINFVLKLRELKLMVIEIVERVVVTLLLFRRMNVDVWLTKGQETSGCSGGLEIFAQPPLLVLARQCVDMNERRRRVLMQVAVGDARLDKEPAAGSFTFVIGGPPFYSPTHYGFGCSYERLPSMQPEASNKKDS